MDCTGKCLGISAPTVEGKVALITQESNLAPSLPVPDLALVLQVCYHFGLARQGPHKASSIWCGVLLGRLHVDHRLMHEGRRLIDCGYQKLHKPVDHVLVVVVIAYFEGVVEENVGCGRKKGSGYRLYWTDIRFLSRLEHGLARRRILCIFVKSSKSWVAS